MPIDAWYSSSVGAFPSSSSSGPGIFNSSSIAGSFGFHLRTASMVHLGLLPAAFTDRVSFVGNTSQSGGRAFLVNAPSRDAMAQVAARVRVLELANDPAFEATFIAALAFPEPHPAQAPQDRPVAVQGR